MVMRGVNEEELTDFVQLTEHKVRDLTLNGKYVYSK